jgi:hypothetical protein
MGAVTPARIAVPHNLHVNFGTLSLIPMLDVVPAAVVM